VYQRQTLNLPKPGIITVSKAPFRIVWLMNFETDITTSSTCLGENLVFRATFL
jgi:hypothetical protein